MATGLTSPFVARLDDRVVGCTLLVRSGNPNSPHRAEIAKVIVHRSARRRGVARALMLAAEDRARADGRWMLVLDTFTGSAADALYRSLGWHETGVVPDYALSPDGRPRPRRSSGRTSGDTARRVLFAPDSFKGSLTSVQVATALADRVVGGASDDTTWLCPLADGGEGTLEAIAAAGGWTWQTAAVARPARPADPGALASLRRRPAGRGRDGRGVRAVARARRPSATRSRPARSAPAT